MRTVLPPISNSMATVLRTRSVVQMAVAAAFAAATLLSTFSANTEMPGIYLSIFILLPMTPVDINKMSSSGTPRDLDNSAAVSLASAIPASPVAAFA